MASIEILVVLAVALVVGILTRKLLGKIARISLYILIGLVVLFLVRTLLSL